MIIHHRTVLNIVDVVVLDTHTEGKEGMSQYEPWIHNSSSMGICEIEEDGINGSIVLHHSDYDTIPSPMMLYCAIREIRTTSRHFSFVLLGMKI